MNAHVGTSIASDLAAVVAKQRAAFQQAAPPTFRQRMADLAQLKKAVLERRREFEASVNADFGTRSPYETTMMEIVPLVQGINYLRRHLKKWMRPRRRHVALYAMPGSARVAFQPLGVIGILSPWNFPLGLALMPLATSIAAGNRAILKPSELTPRTTELMAKMLREIFPEDQVAVVLGGPEIGAAFSTLPFDHLVFTGSTSVGRAVMRAAAENLVPVTLELGGKSPAIVDRGSSLKRAAASIAYGKLANAGQICIAPDYALVHEDDCDAFAAAFENAVHELYPGETSDPAYASIINTRHYTRLSGLVEDARRKGAHVIELGEFAPQERCFAPTIILGATAEMAVMQEEIFGPVLPIMSYKNVNEAIAAINAQPRPLALYLFSDDHEVIECVLARTTSGNVSINDTLIHYVIDDLPFGGVGASGMGAYHGEEGFRSLSHAKGVFQQARWNFAGVARAPFGRMTDLVLSYLLR
jgi:coniferyl-aldehyde dehydrogenase